MKRWFWPDGRHTPLYLIILFCLAAALAACGGENETVPTAVPAASLPQNGVVIGETNGESVAPEVATGDRAPLPSLSGNAPVGGGAVSGTSLGVIITDPFTNTTFTLNAALPEGVTEAPVLRQIQTGMVDLAYARQLANSFGFTGELYQQNFPSIPAEEGGTAFVPPTIYYAFDGSRIFSMDPWSANYHDESVAYDLENPADFVTASQVAEQFLQSRGLLNFPYVIQQGYGNDVFFLRQVDGRTVNQPEIVVGVTADGQVSYVSYQVMSNLETVGLYPLTSVNDAWTLLQTGVTANNIPYTLLPTPGAIPVVTDGPLPTEFQSWQRSYAPGETVQLVGWPNAYLPTSGSGPARVQLYPFDLQGNEETLNQIAEATGQQISVDGVMGDDGKSITVNNWSVMEAMEPLSVQGVARREGDQVLLTANDGQTYVLPNAPADLPDGLELFVYAWTAQQTDGEFPLLQWDRIDQAVTLDTEAAITAEGSVGAVVPAAYESVAIDGVELAYYISYLFPEAVEGEQVAANPTVVLQPVWKFTGTVNGGERIEFFVQAAR